MTLLPRRAGALFALAALFGAGCDCAGPTRPCDGPSPPDACGQSCDATRSCPPGLYCGGSGTCTADCLTSDTSACAAGEVCSREGRCVAGPSDGAARDAPPPDNTCAVVDLGANRVTPNVLLIIDRSGSMRSVFADGMSRWDVLRDALLRQPDGLIARLEASARFGIALYTSDQGEGCPDLITVPTAIDNYDAIAAEYRIRGPANGTPTGDSIQAVLNRIDELVPIRDDPTVFVLATDGEPDTCESSAEDANGRLETLAAVWAAFAMGIRTYVISVGDAIGASHLQDVANAGLGREAGDPDARYWVATNTEGLSEALETIIEGEVSCTLELSGQIDPAFACEGTVRLAGEVLPCDDPNGWRAVDSTHIELTGDACEQLQATGGEVTGSFPCTVIIF